MHTFSSSSTGGTPNSRARAAASTWRVLTGQPHSSRSTFTCAEMGVDSCRVSMNSGCGYTAAFHCAASARLRSACSPPAVAQAPMVIRKRACSRTRRMRSRSSGVAMLPSTKAMSTCGLRIHRAGLGEVDDVDQLAERQQRLARIEEGELAAVAGGELVHRDCVASRPWLRTPECPAAAPRADRGTPARPCRRSPAPAGNGRTDRWRISCCAPCSARSPPAGSHGRAGRG